MKNRLVTSLLLAGYASGGEPGRASFERGHRARIAVADSVVRNTIISIAEYRRRIEFFPRAKSGPVLAKRVLISDLSINHDERVSAYQATDLSPGKVSGRPVSVMHWYGQSVFAIGKEKGDIGIYKLWRREIKSWSMVPINKFLCRFLRRRLFRNRRRFFAWAFVGRALLAGHQFGDALAKFAAVHGFASGPRRLAAVPARELNPAGIGAGGAIPMRVYS